MPHLAPTAPAPLCAAPQRVALKGARASSSCASKMPLPALPLRPLLGRSAAGSLASKSSAPLGARPPCALAAASGVAAGPTAAAGDYVEVHYTGTLDDGTEFDTSRGHEPLAFTVGAGRVVPGFEEIVAGMSVGERRKQRVEAAKAYGEWREGMTVQVPAQGAPEGLEEGMAVALHGGVTAVVTAADAEFVTIDANHALAGKALTFDVEVVKLVPASRLQQATFGAGCFWSVELAFQRKTGVVSTQVGYSQGQVENATYGDVCSGSSGHNEVVRVEFDADEVTYDQLLDVFWEKHDPTTVNRQGGDVGKQYRSGIYCHSAEQRAIAASSLARVNERLGGRVVTEIEDVKNFCAAEDYHQQYLARGGRFGRPQSAAKACSDPIRCYG